MEEIRGERERATERPRRSTEGWGRSEHQCAGEGKCPRAGREQLTCAPRHNAVRASHMPSPPSPSGRAEEESAQSGRLCRSLWGWKRWWGSDGDLTSHTGWSEQEARMGLRTWVSGTPRKPHARTRCWRLQYQNRHDVQREGYRITQMWLKYIDFLLRMMPK